MSQAGWYKANIPFLQVPDKTIQNVYYYRWRTWKEHLRTLQPGEGPVLTEFLPVVSWADPQNAISDAAGHHIMEGRWIRSKLDVQRYIRYWVAGAGQRHQSNDPHADQWVNEYSNWIVYAAWQEALVSGRLDQLERLEPALVRQYNSWSSHFDKKLGLYWQYPIWDAMEYSAASYPTKHDFAGVPTLRPTINAYQYGAAKVIARLAAMRGDKSRAEAFSAKASRIKRNVENMLWSPRKKFFTDILSPHNSQHKRLQARQEIGFVPWYFDLPDARYSVAWKQLMDPQGFFTSQGPTTLEVRDPLYMHEAYDPSGYDGNCCRWDGPSWPYATAQTLTALANLLDDYPAQSDIDKADYDKLLHIYARTQMKQGHPYVAEAHAPSRPLWIYDERDHSEDYNHSSFNDLVISGLIGLRPQADNSLKIKPLVPTEWTYFCLENVPYHGHNITVLYDRSGKQYHQGPGLHIYIDGQQAVSAAKLHNLTVHVPPVTKHANPQFMDDAVNIIGNGYPHPSASYTSPTDHTNIWYGVDGNTWYDEIPEVNTRWTDKSSPNASDTYGVDFGAAIPVDEVHYYAYCNGGNLTAPSTYQVQYWTGSAWRKIARQQRQSRTPVCGDVNRITFKNLTTSRIRLVLHHQSDHFVGLSELKVGSWASSAGRLALGPASGKALAVKPHQALKVQTTFTNTGAAPEKNIHVHLVLPRGWYAKRSARQGKASLRMGDSASQTWQITPAAYAEARQYYSVWAYATFSQQAAEKHTHARTRVRVLK